MDLVLIYTSAGILPTASEGLEINLRGPAVNARPREVAFAVSSVA